MKIGILTFHSANNYGAALQAYALQTAISQTVTGSEVEIIDYRCKGVEKQRSLKKLIKSSGFVSAVLHYPFTKNRIRRIDRFCHENMKLSNYIGTVEELKTAAEKYDRIVSGSDQVWNRNWTGNEDTYLQNFHEHNEKKVSYAVSFGISELPQEWKADYENYLKQFSWLSVREESGKKLLQNEFGLNARVNIDPTLLLTSEQWNKVAVKTNVKKPYVLVYMVPYQKSVAAYARELAEKNGLEVVTVCKSMKKNSGIYKGTAAVEEIIGLFRNAEYVVTNSFHGTAFSVIYHKKFSIEFKNPRGYNLRSKNLLLECGILKDDLPQNSGIIDLFDTDWKDAEEKIEAQRNVSREYFKEFTLL